MERTLYTHNFIPFRRNVKLKYNFFLFFCVLCVENEVALTFLHRANAMIVIKFPGTPTSMKTMQTAVAKCSSPDG